MLQQQLGETTRRLFPSHGGAGRTRGPVDVALRFSLQALMPLDLVAGQESVKQPAAADRPLPKAGCEAQRACRASQGVSGRHPAINAEVKTMRACGTISRKHPGLSLLPPSEPCTKV